MDKTDKQQRLTAFTDWQTLQAAGEVPASLLTEWLRMANAKAWLTGGGR